MFLILTNRRCLNCILLSSCCRSAWTRCRINRFLNGGSFLFRLQMEGVLSSPPPPSSVPGPASTRRLALHAHKLFSHTEPAARESGSTSSIKQSKGWGVMGNHQQPADDGWKIFWQEGSGSCWQVTSCQVLIPALVS